LSWAGSKEFEGHNYIGYGWDQLCVALAAVVFYFWGVRSGWRTPAVEAVEHGSNVDRQASSDVRPRDGTSDSTVERLTVRDDRP
jgi:hypothetical protein